MQPPLKAIENYGKEELPAKAEQIGKTMMEAFKEMQKRYPLIGDVRGQGAMVAFELVKDRASKEPAPEAANYHPGVLPERLTCYLGRHLLQRDALPDTAGNHQGAA